MNYKKLLETALMPVGKTMYIYGGGWNEEDNGSGYDSCRIGISEEWVDFFEKQDKNYDYKKTRYMYGKGLDCSGYIGWVIYNLFNEESGKEGYVTKAKDMAYSLYKRGFGDYKKREEIKDYRLGDIMSSEEHIYMVIGECEDKSVVLVHSSPNGVQINGTVTPENKRGKAIEISEYVMKTKYPKWYNKYPCCERGINYLKDFSQMRWTILDDDEKYLKKSVEELLIGK